MKNEVSVIGLGAMGSALARALQKPHSGGVSRFSKPLPGI